MSWCRSFLYCKFSQHQFRYIDGLDILRDAYVLLGCMIEARIARPIGDNVRSPGWPYDVHIGGARFSFEGWLPAGRANGGDKGSGKTRRSCPLERRLFARKTEVRSIFIRPVL